MRPGRERQMLWRGNPDLIIAIYSNPMSSHRITICVALLLLICGGFPSAADDRVHAELRGYKMMLDLDLANLAKEVEYTIDRRSGFSEGFDRIAYLLELQKAGEKKQWICVTMDAFTTDIMKIGVPTVRSGAFFQQHITGLNVISSLKSMPQGHLGAGGNVEFWPHRYAPHNGTGIPKANSQQFDFDDTRGPLNPGYGCMQVHHHSSRQTLFAINHWQAGKKADVGIGNNPEGHPDWSFAGNAEHYSRKRLRVLVRPTGKPAVRSPWVRSFSSGGRDVNGEFLGGSEIFHIESHKGKLFAATSYWMDENNTYYSNGKRNQWAQVLVKDSKNSPWREDYDTGDDRGVLRPEILQSVTFKRPNPDVNLLFLATYRTDRTKYYVDIMVRNDATGKWIKTTPHSGPKVPDAHDFSVRAMRVYTDRVTREERIFVTVGIQGVLSGVYDPTGAGMDSLVSAPSGRVLRAGSVHLRGEQFTGDRCGRRRLASEGRAVAKLLDRA